MSYYVTCPFCDAHLDPGERCDCRNPPQLNENGAVLANHPANTSDTTKTERPFCAVFRAFKEAHHESPV